MIPSFPLAFGLNNLISLAGTPVNVTYFTSSIGSVWDDDVTLTQSGSVVNISGIVLPLDSRQGSYESTLVQQGKLRSDDMKLFVNGSISFTGSENMVRISVNGEQYTMSDAVIAPEANGIKVYRKAYITRVTNPGELLGEV